LADENLTQAIATILMDEDKLRLVHLTLAGPITSAQEKSDKADALEALLLRWGYAFTRDQRTKMQAKIVDIRNAIGLFSNVSSGTSLAATDDPPEVPW
jgi:hypothetical protein